MAAPSKSHWNVSGGCPVVKTENVAVEPTAREVEALSPTTAGVNTTPRTATLLVDEPELLVTTTW